MSGMLKKRCLRKPESASHFCLAFKVAVHPFLVAHLHSRVLRTIDSGAQVLNSTKDKKERIGKIYQMHANKRKNQLTAVRRTHRMPSWV